MAITSSNNKRIAKNTLFLYFRMIVVMLVSLYTTRVILEILGESNYGIYNVIGGVVVLFTFLNSALSGATQRYLSYALGKEDNAMFNRYYSASILSYIMLAVLIVILAETAGLWFVNNRLSIPDGRMGAANIVYQLTIVTFIINLLKIPFESAIISHEQMSIYAYLSIIDVVLRLGMVFMLIVLPGDKLVDYSILMTLIPLGITTSFGIFCKRVLACRFITRIDKNLFKDLFSYSGWTLLGGLANVAARQGGNILINMFYGVTVNAAFGIANQVSAAVTSLVGSFQTAFRPQIIKLYASQQDAELNKLIFRTSLWSYYLMLIIVLPVVFNLNDILSLWLLKVPQYANIFIICLFIYCMIDALQAPIITNITATANIKVYQIWLSIILIFNLPVSYLFFKNGFPPYWFFIIYAGLNLISAIVRTIYAGYFVQFPVWEYLKKVIIPICYVTALSCGLSYVTVEFMPQSSISFIFSAILIFALTLATIILIGFDKNERKALIDNISGIIRNKTHFSK